MVDRLVRGEARIDEMLVVTFTEKAAAELVRRIRALIRTVLAARGEVDGANVWTIDAAARERLEAAERGLDVAPISTIHAFCQRVLTEHAFSGGRLLAQTHVESRTAFALAFADVIRAPLAEDHELGPLLAVWLAGGQTIDWLETMLYKARQLRCDWGMTYDPERLARAARAFAELPLAAMVQAVYRVVSHKGHASHIIKRLELLLEAVGRLRRRTPIPRACSPSSTTPSTTRTSSSSSSSGWKRGGTNPASASCWRRWRSWPTPRCRWRPRWRSASVRWSRIACARASAAPVTTTTRTCWRSWRRRCAARRAATWRRRCARASGWRSSTSSRTPIRCSGRSFAAIFLDGPAPRPLYVVGDPKQSIYGFRGADVNTYADACRAIGTPGGAQLALDRNFRSTGAVIEAFNALLDQGAPLPFFSAGAGYAQPVRPGGTTEPGDPAQPPLSLLRVKAESEDKLPMRVVRVTLARAIADEVAALLVAPGAPPAHEVFVLTRIRKESQAIAAALAARGVPAVVYGQEGLYETDEARHVRDLLRAIADPHDPGKRLRAWLTPFFALPITELPAAAAGGDQPLRDRLAAWHAAAQSHDLADLFGRILDDSGVVRRELAAGDSLRRLTNYQHLFEVLAAEAGRTGAGVGDLARRLAALVARLVVPDARRGEPAARRGRSRRRPDHDHARRQGAGGRRRVRLRRLRPGPHRHGADVRGRRPPAASGRPPAAGRDQGAGQARARRRGPAPLLRRADARAQTAVPAVFGQSPRRGGREPSTREEYWRLAGGYRHVNRRLRELLAEPARRRLFAPRDIPVDARDVEDVAPPAAGLAAWRPDPADAAPADGEADATFAHLRRARAGAVTTSYSRIKQAHGGYRPPSRDAGRGRRAGGGGGRG